MSKSTKMFLATIVTYTMIYVVVAIVEYYLKLFFIVIGCRKELLWHFQID